MVDWMDCQCIDPGGVFTLDGRIKHSRLALFLLAQRLRFMTIG
jgi:hypothetical protein